MKLVIFVFGFLVSASSIGAKPLSLDFRNHGIYKITWRCLSSATACAAAAPPLGDRLTVLNIYDDWDDVHRLSVTMSSSVLSEPISIYRKIDVIDAGQGLAASSFDSHRFDYVEVHFDASLGSLRGKAVDTIAGLEYEILGHGVGRVGDWLDGGARTIPVDRLAGRYSGKIGNLQGTLTISALPNDRWVASFSSQASSHGQPHLRLKFQAGLWHPTEKVFYLTGPNTRFEGSLLLVIRPRIETSLPHSPIKLEGFYTASAVASEIRFE